MPKRKYFRLGIINFLVPYCESNLRITILAIQFEWNVVERTSLIGFFIVSSLEELVNHLYSNDAIREPYFIDNANRSNWLSRLIRFSGMGDIGVIDQKPIYFSIRRMSALLFLCDKYTDSNSKNGEI